MRFKTPQSLFLISCVTFAIACEPRPGSLAGEWTGELECYVEGAENEPFEVSMRLDHLSQDAYFGSMIVYEFSDDGGEDFRFGVAAKVDSWLSKDSPWVDFYQDNCRYQDPDTQRTEYTACPSIDLQAGSDSMSGIMAFEDDDSCDLWLSL